MGNFSGLEPKQIFFPVGQKDIEVKLNSGIKNPVVRNSFNSAFEFVSGFVRNFPIFGGHSNGFSAEDTVKLSIRHKGMIKNLIFTCLVNDIDAGTSTIKFRNGGANMGTGLSIPFGTTGTFEINEDLPIFPFDLLNLQVIVSGTAGSLAGIFSWDIEWID